MGKKVGAVPGLNNAVGQASLGRIPGSSSQPPLTPDRILGRDTSNKVAEGVGALGTGTWGAYGPSPTTAFFGGGRSTAPTTPAYPTATAGMYGGGGSQMGMNQGNNNPALMAQAMRQYQR